MKRIPLSGKNTNKYMLVDDDDYEELSKYDWYLTSRGYPSCTIRAHYLVMKKYKRDGKTIVDHINGNPFDNRKSNLRFATHSQNMQNKKRDSRNKAGYKGVVKRLGNRINPYICQIGNGKSGNQIYLGSFPTAEDAARAYDKEAKIRYGEFARLNFPEDK